LLHSKLTIYNDPVPFLYTDQYKEEKNQLILLCIIFESVSTQTLLFSLPPSPELVEQTVMKTDGCY